MCHNVNVMWNAILVKNAFSYSDVVSVGLFKSQTSLLDHAMCKYW